MATYPEWNEALCAFLFNDENAGKTVYLHVPEEAFADDERLCALGGYQAFKADMLMELGGAPAELLILADRKWQEDLRYLRPDSAMIIPGHLSLMLVLSAATEVVREDVEPHAFYPLIPCFFGMRHEGFELKEKELVTRLYNRISSWSIGSLGGSRGVFKPQQLGARSKVGLIQAQTIYRVTDVEELQYQFQVNGYRPGDEYSAEEFEQLLKQGSFSPRIEKALANEHLRQVAIMRAQEELESWDGSLSDEAKAKLGEGSGESGRVLIQLYSDSSYRARRTIGIRLREQRDYFDDYSVLIPTSRRTEPVKRLVTPDSRNPGLSRVIIKHAEARAEGVASFTSSFDIRSEDKTLFFSYKAKPVRFFIPAETAGLVGVSGWVDTPVMTKGKRHILMIDRNFYDEFLRCNASKLIKHQALQEPIDESLTLIFQFLTVERITEPLVDANMKVIGSFAMTDRPKVRTMFGLKASGRGNTFMRNSPPRLQVTGLDEGSVVQLDERYFSKIGEDNSPSAGSVDFQVKEGVLLPDSLAVVVIGRDGLTLARCELHFEDYKTHEVSDPPVNSIGAIVESLQMPDPYRPWGNSYPVPIVPELKLLGRRPGELSALSRHADIIEPCWLVEIRGAEKTLHYVAKESVTSINNRFAFNVVRNPSFMGPVLTQSWAKFLFEGNIRCGTCAKPLPVSASLPELSPIRDFLAQQRDFVRANFNVR